LVIIAFPVELTRKKLNSIQHFPETKRTGKLSCGKAKSSNCACPRDHFPVPVATFGKRKYTLKNSYIGYIINFRNTGVKNLPLQTL